ncbi:MAG TPA: hypothetical protein VNN79_09050 [Actinomycetota bacterium]|nr:hypothetical protein [Actinomycetota bacterium]
MSEQEQFGRNNTMVIRGTNHPRHWREVEVGEDSGCWRSDGQPGPGPVVWVTREGVRVSGIRPDLNPGAARWLGNRLIEAAAVYETVFGGDGSLPKNGGHRPVRQLDVMTLPDTLKED